MCERGRLGGGNDGRDALLKPGDVVLVAGATGGVGQLLCAKLLERGYRVIALSRNASKTRSLLGSDVENLSVVTGDLRSPESLAKIDWSVVNAVCCCTGTTAFPSKRWDNDNTPEQTDLVANKNLIGGGAQGPSTQAVRSVHLCRRGAIGTVPVPHSESVWGVEVQANGGGAFGGFGAAPHDCPAEPAL